MDSYRGTGGEEINQKNFWFSCGSLQIYYKHFSFIYVFFFEQSNVERCQEHNFYYRQNVVRRVWQYELGRTYRNSESGKWSRNVKKSNIFHKTFSVFIEITSINHCYDGHWTGNVKPHFTKEKIVFSLRKNERQGKNLKMNFQIMESL